MAGKKDGKELFGTLVTVLGGSGFFGRHLAQELLRRGARLRIASRSPARAFRLKPLAAIGQIELVRCDVTSQQSLQAALAGADMVVNLVGAFGGDLDGLQGKGVRRIVQAAQDAGARAFVHVSAIGADPESRFAYARTKGEGETAARAGYPNATIMRPSILFAQDDAFTTMFGRLIANFPALPVFGPDAKLQPVYVDDAAAAIVAALIDPEAYGGKTFELAGPEVITMLELNRRIAAAQGRRRGFLPLPDAVSGAIASAVGWLPGAPISRDQWGLLKQGNVASGALPGLADLGVTAHPLGLYLNRWMVPMRKHGRFGAKLAER